MKAQDCAHLLKVIIQALTPRAIGYSRKNSKQGEGEGVEDMEFPWGIKGRAFL